MTEDEKSELQTKGLWPMDDDGFDETNTKHSARGFNFGQRVEVRKLPTTPSNIPENLTVEQLRERVEPTPKPTGAPREWRCMFDPQTGELTYGHNHGCTDGFEDVHVIEKSYADALQETLNWKDNAFRLAIEQRDQALAELEEVRKFVGIAEQGIRTLSALKAELADGTK